MVNVRVRPRQRQSGAAILLALLIMTLIATLAAGMVWLQWRGIEVEAAERARAQAEWLLNASLDWGNLILKSSIRNGQTEDDLGQPWATPLAETKLSSFLSADGNHDAEGGPEAYLSGQISDAESKYNLYNLIVPAPVAAGAPGGGNAKFDEINRFKILCTAIGIAPDIATTLGSGLRNSWDAQQAASTGGQTGDSVLMPVQLEDLAWYGIDPKVLKQLQPFVQLLPPPNGETLAITNINLNTAPAEVLMAAVPGLTRAQAQQMILSRQTHPFISLAAAWTSYGVGAVGPKIPDGDPPLQAAFKSQHFEIYGQLRLEQHVVRERSVVYRKDQFAPIQVLRRERIPPDAT